MFSLHENLSRGEHRVLADLALGGRLSVRRGPEVGFLLRRGRRRLRGIRIRTVSRLAFLGLIRSGGLTRAGWRVVKERQA